MTDQQNLVPIGDLQTISLQIQRNLEGTPTVKHWDHQTIYKPAYILVVVSETYISVSSLKGVVGRVVPSDVVDPVGLVDIPLRA